MADKATHTSPETPAEKPPWFMATFIGAVFATIVLPNSMHAGFGAFVLNAIAIACFVVPLVAWQRESRETGLQA